MSFFLAGMAARKYKANGAEVSRCPVFLALNCREKNALGIIALLFSISQRIDSDIVYVPEAHIGLMDGLVAIHHAQA